MSLLPIAILSMVLALTFYTVGVWGEKIVGRLKAWHLIFFWLGLIFDTLGTTLMGRIAGSFSFNMHAVTGLAAIILMIVHAVWATGVLMLKREDAVRNFHRFSLIVWFLWLIPFVSGLILAMGK
ncbi:MAG: HsmA family protein [Anaerolineae bacterium]|nr:HsmA family protein [Anaerolineae bacterium]